MPVSRRLTKVHSGGGLDYQPAPSWLGSFLGPGEPIRPIPYTGGDTEIPRSIDYPIAINSMLTPRTGYGLMPFSQISLAYEKVPECRSPVSLIHRQLSAFIPRLLDSKGNAVKDHPYNWMTEYPDGVTPFNVWMGRYIKSMKIYDAPALYFERDSNGITGLHYIDGSTLFVILDEFGNTPNPEPIERYVDRVLNPPRDGSLPSGTRETVPGAALGPATIDRFVEAFNQRFYSRQPVPDKIPAYVQVIKGTPFAWWAADDIWYMPQSRRVNAPYGEPFIEAAWPWIMILANLLSFEVAHYRTGNMPEGFVTLPRDWLATPDQLEALELAFNQRMTANPATERNRIRLYPEGSQWFQTKRAEWQDPLYSRAWQNVLYNAGMTEQDFGEMPGDGLGGKGQKQGAANEMNRNTLNPARRSIAEPFNHALKRDGVTDVRFSVDYPIEEIDPEKLKQDAYAGMSQAVYSLNEVRALFNMAPIGSVTDPENIANKHLLMSQGGVIIVEDAKGKDGFIQPPQGEPTPGANGGTPADTPPEPNAEMAKRIAKNIEEYGNIEGRRIFAVAKPLQKYEVAQHTDGCMVALMMPFDIATYLSNLTRELKLPPEAIVEPAATMHVTLAYLVDPTLTELQLVAEAMTVLAECCPPVEGLVSGWGVFNAADDSTVLYAILDSPVLPALRQSVCDVLDLIEVPYSREHGFVPHITMAYLPAGTGVPSWFAIENRPVKIPWLTVAQGSQYGYAPFGGELAKHCGVCEEDDAYYGAPISREVTFDFPKTHHANKVEIVAMTPEGLPPKPGLWKPEGGEDPALVEWIGGPMYPREEAAYLLDRALGFELVPVAYVGNSYGEFGAVVYYTLGNLPPLAPEDYGQDWQERAGVFDYITCQKDRANRHNYFTHPDDTKRMVLYDNGLSMPPQEQQYHSPFADLIRGRELSSSVKNALARAYGNDELWASLRGLVGQDAVDLVRHYIQVLLVPGPVLVETTPTTTLTKWDEGLHPRGPDGKFAPAGGGGAAERAGVGAKGGWDRDQAPKGYEAIVGGEEDEEGEDRAARIDRKHSEIWKSKLDRHDIRAVRAYTSKGDSSLFNDHLRSKEAVPESVQLSMKDLDTALAKSPGMDADRVVYRGLTDLGASNFKVGRTYTDKGYMSTSISKAVASQYTFTDADSALFHITAPKGTPGAYVKSLSDYDEHEFLMPRGTKIKIDHIATDAEGLKHIYAHVVTKRVKRGE